MDNFESSYYGDDDDDDIDDHIDDDIDDYISTHILDHFESSYEGKLGGNQLPQGSLLTPASESESESSWCVWCTGQSVDSCKWKWKLRMGVVLK